MLVLLLALGCVASLVVGGIEAGSAHDGGCLTVLALRRRVIKGSDGQGAPEF
jgi:hypothetical protein